MQAVQALDDIIRDQRSRDPYRCPRVTLASSSGRTGRFTGQKGSVDSNDEIGCVAAWLQVWLTPCEVCLDVDLSAATQPAVNAAARWT
jgi:hypothetical protein